MGFFSWTCAKSKKPIMADCGVRNSPWEFASKVVVVYRHGSRINGAYDGYGRVQTFKYGDVDLTELGPNEWRMVIEKYYDDETFDQLERNENEPNQGWFYGNTDLARIFDCGWEWIVLNPDEEEEVNG